jgi:hypothetical protein
MLASRTIRSAPMIDPIDSFAELLPTLDRRTVINARAVIGDRSGENEIYFWNALVEAVNTRKPDVVSHALAMLDEAGDGHDPLGSLAHRCDLGALRSPLPDVAELLRLVARMAIAAGSDETVEECGR